jgi:SpoVK/Ycf46/Vps4 family AAA+-type ATPase
MKFEEGRKFYTIAADGSAYKFADEVPANFQADVLPAGVYTYHRTMFYNYVVKSSIESEEIVPFVGKVYEEFRQRLMRIFDPKFQKLVKDNGEKLKSSFILYGPKGSGKSVMAKSVIDEMIDKHDVIVIKNDAISSIKEAVSAIRQREPNRFIVWFVDECEDTFEYENEVADFLDGGNSTDNFMFLGITNKPSEFSNKFFGRPSRIKEWFFMDAPPKEMQIKLMARKLPNHIKPFAEDFVEWIIDIMSNTDKELTLNVDILKHVCTDTVYELELMDKQLSEVKQEDIINTLTKYLILNNQEVNTDFDDSEY